MVEFICGMGVTLLAMGLVESLIKPFTVVAFRHNLPDLLAELYDRYDNWADSDDRGSVTRDEAQMKVRGWLEELTGQQWNQKSQDWIVNRFRVFVGNWIISVFRRKFDPFVFASKHGTGD